MIPDYDIRVDGAALTDILRDRLASIRVVLTVDREADNLEIDLTDPVRELAEPTRGRTLAVSLGYRGDGLAAVGEFVHSATVIDLAPRALRIQGAATDFAGALKAPTTRAWHDTTLGVIVAGIATRHGLGHAADAGLAGEAIAHLDQTAESDIHFLRRLAKQYDATTKIAAGRVLFLPAGSDVSARSRELLPLVTVRPPAQGERKLLEGGSLRRSDRSRYARVRARYYDLGEATHVYVAAGAGEPVYDMRDTYPNRSEAEAAANGQLARLTRSTARIDLTVRGDTAAVAGGRLETAGWSGGEDGDWTIARVVHTLTPSQGFRTSLSAAAHVP